jgi:amino acid adenylation domain-containing protein
MTTEAARRLAGMPRLPLVGDPRSVQAPEHRQRQRRIPADTWRCLRTRGQAAGLSVSTVLAGAFVATLTAWSRDSRFSIGLGTGRTGIDVDTQPADTGPPVCLLECMRTLQMQRPLPMPQPATVRYSSGLGDGWPAGGTGAPAGEVLLAHHVAEDGAELVLTWRTLDAAFPTGLLDDLVAAHAELVEQLADDPAVWTDPAPELLPERQRQTRKLVNATDMPLEPLLLHEPFWQQAAHTPQAPAIIAADRTVTYAQLRSGATAVAAQLTNLGPQRNRVVAVVMDRCWEQYVAVLGVLAAGAAYVPITPDLPTDRIHHLLRHAQATVAVTHPQLVDTLALPDEVAPLMVTEQMLAAAVDETPPLLQQPEDLAYIIYTSGSTGQPKGVMISHRAAVNTILDINRRFQVGQQDRVFALSSLGFDLSVYDIFGLLAAGGAIVVPPPDASRAPWEWTELLTTHRVTIWNTVPALMEMLVEYAAGRRLPIADSLRLVLMSGDWIPVTLPARIRERANPDIALIGLGGATEASIWSNFYPIGEVDPAWPSIPYGKPLTNQFFEVLDPALRRRPELVPGELYIGGTGVAMGYWRDPDKTRRSFITHPRTGERLYRTGDLGRYLTDGNLEFLGREDFQVKIHGFRIELGEIEATLLSHPEVTGAVVTAVDAAGGGKRLVAYLTPTAVPVDQIREYLSAKLPAHMVPDHLLTLDAFPLTANGKVDRKSLPAPDRR